MGWRGKLGRSESSPRRFVTSTTVVTEPEAIKPAVDFALLADSVQAVGGKLYLLGGGWDTLFVSGFPARHHSMAIGLRVRVPWSPPAVQVRIGVELVDADGRRILPNEVGHTLTVSSRQSMDRPDTGVIRSFTFNNLTFEAEGDYSFVISLDGEVSERLRFAVRKRR